MTQEYELTLADPNLRPMLKMRLHTSLIAGLRSAGALPETAVLVTADAERLRIWASHLDSQSQRGCIVRALAELVTVGNGAEIHPVGEQGKTGDFWDAVGRM